MEGWPLACCLLLLPNVATEADDEADTTEADIEEIDDPDTERSTKFDSVDRVADFFLVAANAFARMSATVDVGACDKAYNSPLRLAAWVPCMSFLLTSTPVPLH